MIDGLSDLNDIVADLRGAGEWVGQRSIEVTQKAGEKVRDDARRLAPRTGLPHYGAAITSEVRRSGYTVEAEIGPEKGGQGSLGHILEFGTTRTPPHAHLGPSLDMNASDYERALSKLLDPFQ